MEWAKYRLAIIRRLSTYSKSDQLEGAEFGEMNFSGKHEPSETRGGPSVMHFIWHLATYLMHLYPFI
jgi:hypothetical protein